MNEALVVILALLWALILLPGALRSRRSSPISSIGTFERAMDVLRNRSSASHRILLVPNDAGRIVGDPASHRRALLARRRRTFARLLAAAALTLLVGVALGGRWWLLFVLSAAAVAVYVAVLLRWKAQTAQAARVVRALPESSPPSRDRELVGVVAGDRVFADVQVATRPDEPWAPQAGVRIRRWEG